MADVTVQAGFDYRMPTLQIAGMYWLTPTSQLGLKTGRHRTDEGERQTSISLQYKHFLKNSFYISPEIFYLNTRERYSRWQDNGEEKRFTEYVSMGTGVRIGNQWIFNHFTCGLDWIGVGSRLGTFRREGPNSNSLTLTLFNMYAGVSF